MTKICLKNAVVKTYLESYEPDNSPESNKHMLNCIINQVSNEVRYPGKSIAKLPEIVTFVTLRQIIIQNINILRLPTDICLSFPNLIDMQVSAVTHNNQLLPSHSALQLKNLKFKDQLIDETLKVHDEDVPRNPALPWIPIEEHKALQHLSRGLITLPELHEEQDHRAGVLDTPVISQAERSAVIQQALAFSVLPSDGKPRPKDSETFHQLIKQDPKDDVLLPESVRMALISKEPSRRGGRRGSVFHQFGFPATTFV